MEVAQLLADNMKWLETQAQWFCRCSEDAKEIMAQTMLRCLESAGSFDSCRAFRPWAKTVMRHVSADHFRRNRYIPVPDPLIFARQYFTNITESDIIAADINEIIASMAKKSESARCLRLYLLGYSYKEIATIQNISIGTVKSRLNSARKKLRNYL